MQLSTVHTPEVKARWLATAKHMLAHDALSPSEYVRIRGIISDGISLEFPDGLPPPSQLANSIKVTRSVAFCVDRLQHYIKIGAVVRPTEQDKASYDYIQPLIVIEKPGKKPRLVLDLSRNLNDFTPPAPVQYDSVEAAILLARPNDWFAKHDLSDCFLSFDIHPEHRRFFTFELAGTIYQFARMPFGLKQAPRDCTLLLSVVAHAMRLRGVSLVRFLDDFLYNARSRAEGERMLVIAAEVFASFGLRVNDDKTVLPSQRIVFLGILLDSVARTVGIDEDRRNELVALIDERLTRTSEHGSLTVSALQLQSLLGKFSFAATVLPGSRPFLRRGFDLLRSLGRVVGLRRRDTRITLSTLFCDDLLIWRNHIDVWNGSSPWSSLAPHPSAVLYADASSSYGCGFLIASPTTPPGSATRVSLRWTAAWRHAVADSTNIQVGELFAVVAAVAYYLPALAGQHILLFSDNAAVVSIVNRQRTKSPSDDLRSLLRSLCGLLCSNRVQLSLRYVRTEDNPADCLSRGFSHLPAEFSCSCRLHLRNSVRGWMPSCEWHPACVCDPPRGPSTAPNGLRLPTSATAWASTGSPL
ncbi:MAG: reverse transcriptase domain-containing protein [Bacteroidota bacterium]